MTLAFTDGVVPGIHVPMVAVDALARPFSMRPETNSSMIVLMFARCEGRVHER